MGEGIHPKRCIMNTDQSMSSQSTRAPSSCEPKPKIALYISQGVIKLQLTRECKYQIRRFTGVKDT